MPQRKTVESLVDQCVKYVALRMNDWIRDDQSGQIVTFFNSLPSTLLEEMIKTLVKKKKLTKLAFQQLLTSQIRYLDVSHSSSNAEMAHYLRLASIKCPQLTNLVCRKPSYLQMDEDPKILQIVYLKFLPKFEQLQVLILEDSLYIGDECLCTLGSFATKLIELNVSKCPKVTDAGIKGLCVMDNATENEDERTGQCQLLEYLIITETSVTKMGVKMAFENLPALLELECDYSVTDILFEMHQEASEKEKEMKKFSLTLLENSETGKNLPYRIGSIGFAVSLCPSTVTRLVIHIQKGLTDEEFLLLSGLTILEDLTIKSGSACDVTFDGGVIPLLEAIGSSLDALSLEGLEDVNIFALIEFCPNLGELDLSENLSYSAARRWTYQNPKRRRTENAILEKLEILLIEDIIFYEGRSTHYGGVVPCEILLLLLASPLLKELSVQKCESLTDDILSQAAHLHGFTRLESLDIRFCPCVTNEGGIALFMNETNPLTRICLSILIGRSRKETSAHITLKNIEEWKLKAQRENWDVEIY